jgi:hypothetical protein
MIMKDIPLKIEHNREWLLLQANVGKDRISFPAPVDLEIPFESIVDLENRKKALAITVKGTPETVVTIGGTEKVLGVLKRLMLGSCTAHRLPAYFMSPALHGGILVKDARWEKGSVNVVRSSIWLVSDAKQVPIAFRDVGAIKLTKREMNGKQTDVVNIDHKDTGETVSSLVLAPLPTLQSLTGLVKDATKGVDPDWNSLGDVGREVARLLHSGMDTKTIGSTLNLSPGQLDEIYDKIISLGLAEVSLTRRELRLTSKGVRSVSDHVKMQTP